jgi:hypothetical protein
VRDKLRLTEELVRLIPEDVRPTLEEARLSWWYNLRAGGGLRLTEHGYHVLTEIVKLEHYDYILDPVRFTTLNLVDLDKKLQMPYYISLHKRNVKKITFFSSQEAVLVNLYGDLEKFLNNYQG